MVAGQITGGRVVFEDGLKASQDYAPAKKATVELRFECGPGEDYKPLFNLATAEAMERVYVMLRGEKLVPAASVVDNGTGKTDKDKLADKVTKPRKPPTPAAPDPADIDVVTVQPAQTHAISEGVQAMSPADPAAVEDDLSSAPTEITDAMLTEHIGKKRAQLPAGTEGALPIRQLIGRYTPQDGGVHQAREIPQAKRQGFLVELGVLHG